VHSILCKCLYLNIRHFFQNILAFSPDATTYHGTYMNVTFFFLLICSVMCTYTCILLFIISFKIFFCHTFTSVHKSSYVGYSYQTSLMLSSIISWFSCPAFMKSSHKYADSLCHYNILADLQHQQETFEQYFLHILHSSSSSNHVVGLA
jgi:hypothetical protein